MRKLALILGAWSFMAGHALASPLGAMLEDALLLQPGIALPEGAQIQFAYPGDMDAADYVSDFRHDPGTSRFQARVATPDGQSQLLSGTYRITIDIPVVARRIARGEVIREGDVTMRTIPYALSGDHIIQHMDDLVGLEARRAIQPDRPVPTSAAGAPYAVRKGGEVLLVLDDARMALTSKGRALENAALGDEVRVQNLVTRKTVIGTVEAAARIKITPAAKLEESTK